MNQEIQLSVTPNPPVAANPLGTGLMSTQLPQGPQTALQLIHGLMRGRYGVALVLGLLFAIAGAAAGFLFPRPSYQSVGLLEVKPVVTTPENFERVMPMYEYYVASVVQKIKSDQVIRVAMKDPAVLKLRPNAGATSAEITKGLTPKHLANTSLVSVTFESDQKDAREFCPIVVSAVIHAYDDNSRDMDEVAFNQAMNAREGDRKKLESDITLLQGEIDTLTANIGDDPQLVIANRQHEHSILSPSLIESEQSFQAAKLALDRAQSSNAKAPYSVDDLVLVHPGLATKVQTRAAAEEVLNNIALRNGTSHPLYASAKERYDTLNKQVNDLVKSLNEKMFMIQKPDGSNTLIPKDLTSLHEIYLAKKNNLDALDKDIQNLQNVSRQVSEKRRLLQKTQDTYALKKKKIDEMEAMHQLSRNFNVVDYNSPPIVSSDKRVMVSVVGFIAGGGLPIGLMMLAGLMNPRVRYSDETSREVSGVTLLGILPDLPDRLSDPEQASIAAHCVHQIRTMLQINNHTQDRRVFAITSAAPGDGKTSLTLALGLSYAACGTRTLLIDCDLVGAGLTTRMNVTASEGVLEAIANRSLLEYVRSTDVSDVAILPVGMAQGLHASTLSPAALRRLVDEAKKHFDTVLIDTGPILGSIEASLVCTAADAVVLAVSRGQQRPLVEKAIAHLNAIGTRLAGVVFNRAQASDFERSISGMSVRANPNSQGGRIGPVARAVQSSFKRGT